MYEMDSDIRTPTGPPGQHGTPFFLVGTGWDEKSVKNGGVNRPDSGEQYPTSPAACEGENLSLGWGA